MYIYKTTNLLNGKIYIGLTTRSLNETIEYYGSGIKIIQALDKYGKENFSKEIIEHCNSIKALHKAERHWISHYNSTDPSIGYNIADGGNNFKRNPNRDEVSKNLSKGQLERFAKNPMIMSENHRLAIKAARNTPEQKAITSKAHKGKKRSQAWKDKISKSSKGKTISEEQRIKISKTLKAKPKIRDVRTCPICNSVFEVIPSSTKKYCSCSCSAKGRVRKRY